MRRRHFIALLGGAMAARPLATHAQQTADRVFLHNRERMMDFASNNRLPSVNAYRELVEAGGLMSFGPSYEDMHRRAAGYVDMIIKGANPGDLPVQQPTKFTLVINLKAAKALGVTIPESFLVRADDVIE
jgi:putative tryptophan/tyrosine transport system substrate-binding protein